MMSIFNKKRLGEERFAALTVFILFFSVLAALLFPKFIIWWLNVFPNALKLITPFVLFCGLLSSSLLIYYKVKNVGSSIRKVHRVYAVTFGLIFTSIVGVYALYNDAFEDQENRVTPVVNALQGNKSKFSLGQVYENDEERKLVFAIDVSKSSRSVGSSVAQTWLEGALNYVEGCPFLYKGTEIRSNFPETDGEWSGLDVIKLKVSKLLIESRNVMVEDWERDSSKSSNYPCYLFSFGQSTDLHSEFNLASVKGFNNAIESVMSLSYTENSDWTDNERLIDKINEFASPRDHWNRDKLPQTSISIFSDFVNDTKNENTERLKSLVSELASTSTYFNLYTLPYTGNKANTTDVRGLFDDNLAKGQMNVQSIFDDIDIRLASLWGRPIIFLYQPNSKMLIESEVTLESKFNLGEVGVVLRKNSGDKNDIGQFYYRRKRLSLDSEILDNPYNSDVLLEYEGTVNQSEDCHLEFNVVSKGDLLNFQVAFRKLLPWYIGVILCALGVWSALVSVVYVTLIMQYYLFGRSVGIEKEKYLSGNNIGKLQ